MGDRISHRRIRWVLGALLGLGVVAATSGAEDALEPREEFQAVCAALRGGSENYFGARPLAELKERLAGSFETDAERAVAEIEYGRELLEWGRTGESIAALERALGGAATLEPWQVAWLLRTLGLAHLQASEDRHCIASPNSESCLLPIRGAGVHADPTHARLAARIFLQLLKGHPDDAEAAWLANLASMLAGESPDSIPASYRAPRSRFETGSWSPWSQRNEALGELPTDLAGGAVMDDFDGDGLLDLISTTSDPCGPALAFRNDGKGGFEDVSARWGLADQLGGLGLIHGDYDGDGRLDLLILRGAWLGKEGAIRNSLLRNEPQGESSEPRFVDRTHAAGLAEPPAPTQAAAWSDYDGDGDLDLYVGNETSDDAPTASQLFRNNGDGTFSDVAVAAGVLNGRYAKSVAWGDYDDDGDPDLYVSNLGPNRLYRNSGDGGFVDVATTLGVTEPEGRSFATWFFDYDNDSDLDLFVADYGVEVSEVAGYFLGREAAGGQPRLYRNDGGSFSEVSREVGLSQPALIMGANFGDLDNDGFEDLYLGTGDPEFGTLFPNLLYSNSAEGRFTNQSGAVRLGHLQKGHGVAFGDLDNDGDLDLYHQLGGFYPGDAYSNALFENPGVEGNRWLALELKGRGANRYAVGARVAIGIRLGEERRTLHRVVGSGGPFGGSSLRLEIGLGRATQIEELVVSWPAGDRQRWTQLDLDSRYRVVEGESDLIPIQLPEIELGRH